MKLKSIVIFIVAGAFLVGGWLFLGKKDSAPPLAATTLQGEQLSLDGLKGKVVLVNFWATSCTTCMAEMPKLMEIHRKYTGKGFETLAVAMDYDPAEYVKTYVQKSGLPFKVILDSKGEIAKSFGGIRLTPTSILIDKQGRVVQTYLGEPDFAKFQALLEELLAA